MRLVLQRVLRASVAVEGETVARIGRGLLAFVGVEEGDGPDDALRLARKAAELRCFDDGEGRTNLGLEAVNGALLAVPQFTLAADCRKGRRPSFARAARGAEARSLFESFADEVEARGVPVARGRFGAHMAVDLLNDGPVTLLLSSRGAF